MGERGQKNGDSIQRTERRSIPPIGRSRRKSEKLCAMGAIIYRAQEDIASKSLKQSRLWDKAVE